MLSCWRKSVPYNNIGFTLLGKLEAVWFQFGTTPPDVIRTDQVVRHYGERTMSVWY